MIIKKSNKIQGVKIITPDIYYDERGELSVLKIDGLLKSSKMKIFDQNIISISNYGVLRGLHYQINQPLIQMIQCIEGEVLDFAIDLRKSSKTFKKIFKKKINGNNKNIILLPPGVAHGYLTLSSKSILLYCISGKYDKKYERGINYKGLNLKLPLEPLVINSRDQNWPSLSLAEIYDNL